MARYSVYTKLDPEEAIRRAVAYFGESGLGLEVTDQGACCASFQGGGGHVSVTVNTGDQKTELELVTREYDYDVKRFMREIA
jgi:hypothetical protein